MLPIVVHEQTTRFFNYYFQGEIYQGMCFQKRLYRLLHAFTQEQRLYAYKFASSLAQCNEIVITVSNEHYQVWIDLALESKCRAQHTSRHSQLINEPA